MMKLNENLFLTDNLSLGCFLQYEWDFFHLFSDLAGENGASNQLVKITNSPQQHMI